MSRSPAFWLDLHSQAPNAEHDPVTSSESCNRSVAPGLLHQHVSMQPTLTLFSSHLMKSCTSCSVRCELDTTDMGQARVSAPF